MVGGRRYLRATKVLIVSCTFGEVHALFPFKIVRNILRLTG